MHIISSLFLHNTKSIDPPTKNVFILSTYLIFLKCLILYIWSLAQKLLIAKQQKAQKHFLASFPYVSYRTELRIFYTHVWQL